MLRQRQALGAEKRAREEQMRQRREDLLDEERFRSTRESMAAVAEMQAQPVLEQPGKDEKREPHISSSSGSSSSHHNIPSASEQWRQKERKAQRARVWAAIASVAGDVVEECESTEWAAFESSEKEERFPIIGPEP